jgi:hypothetical protein
MKKILLSLFVCTGFTASSFAQIVADFSGSPTTLCAGGNVSWTNLTTGAGGGANYAWQFPGGVNPTSTNPNPGPRNYSVPGTYDVTLIVTNGPNADTMIKKNYITVLAGPSVVVTPNPAFICVAGSVTLNASGANTYVWAPANGLNSTTGATVISTRTTSITYTVVGTNGNGCTSGTAVSVSVNNSAPATPGGITGPTTVCSGQTADYSVPGVAPPAPNRTWTVPPGATIIAGQGTRSITVTFGSTSGNVCCTASNACGASAPSCQAITVNPTPAVGTVGTITGPTAVCANQAGVTYSIAPVANALTYNWTASAGANITAGQGTNTITVTFATNNSNICVTASNSCNTSPQVCKAVTVSGSTPAIPGAISGPTTVCSGQSGVIYTVGNVAGTTVYSWSTAATASITAGQGTRTVTISYGSATETICVTAGNACGTSLASCQPVFVDPSPALGSIGTITGLSAVCANQSGVVYSVGAVANATSYNWTLPAGANITAGTGTNTITVTFATTAGNVCVDAMNNCSSSAQSCKAVSVSPNTPAIPGAITGPTTVCNGQSGITYTIGNVASATVYTWSTAATASITAGQGTRTVTISFGSASETICVTAGNACGTSLANCVNVTVDASPAVGTISTINGPTAVCANQSGIIFSTPAVANATTYNWTVPGTATVTAGQGTNTITVTFGAAPGQVCVTANNVCSSSAQVCQFISVSATTPAIPGAITGPTTVCSGQGGVDYTIGNVAGTTVYTWSVNGGATISAGQGTRTVTITFGSATSSVCVTAGNACGTSLATCTTVSVSPQGVVGTVGAITGPAAVCQNQSNVTYSIVPVINATSYNWTVPGTATVTAGQGTATITVSFSTGGGNICVDASNSCSSAIASCQAITVAPSAPVIPGAITGVTTVCSGQSGVAYSISSVANATSYTWSVPAGSSITAGQGTTAATINFSSTPGIATVSVTAGNACGTSLASTLNVTIDPSPALGTIGTISGPTSVCANQTNVTYIIPTVTNAVVYVWTVPASATVTAGQGTQTITVTFGNVSGNVCVAANNSCGTSPLSCLTLTVSPNAPSIPLGITGATTVCSGQVGNYSVAPVANALTYTWTAPGATITSGQGTNNVVITFAAASTTVCVSAANGCGTSLNSCQPITVSSAVLTVSTTVTNASSSSSCDGSATATPGGGTGPYTYAWSPSGGAGATASNLCPGGYTVCVTDAGGCVTCKNVTVSSPTGVPAITDNGTIKVYPNPANDFIFVEGTLNGAANMQVNIVNMFGQTVIDKMVHADGQFSEKISIANIPTGVYFIEISSGDMLRNKKIIKIQ